MVGVKVFVSFHPGKRHAVVRGDDDEGVVELPLFFEMLDDPEQMRIEVFNFKRVVEHVRANDLVVRPVSGHAVDVLERLSAFFNSDLVFVGTVWFGGSVPERPGFFAGFGIGEKILEIAGVVVVRNLFRRWFRLVFGIWLAGEQTLFALRVLGDPRCPGLAGAADEVAGLSFQSLRVTGEFGREERHMVRRFFQLPGISSRKNAGPARRAFCIRSESLMKKQTLPCNPVKARRFHPVRSVGRGMRPRLVVGNGEKDIGTLVGLYDGDCQKENNGYGERTEHDELVLYGYRSRIVINFRILHLEAFQRLDDDVRDEQIAIPLPVGGNDIPRCVVCACLLKHIGVGLHEF